MKRSLALFILAVLFFSSTALAQEKGFGLGLIIGEPTGLSFKNWISSQTALDFGVAWSFGQEDSLHFHADYLTHSNNLFNVKRGNLLLYYGVGGRIKAQKKKIILRETGKRQKFQEQKEESLYSPKQASETLSKK